MNEKNRETCGICVPEEVLGRMVSPVTLIFPDRSKKSYRNGEALAAALAEITDPCLFEGPCSEDMIRACPGGAISAEGIDKEKCRDYCRKFNETTPVPDVCGKCFRFI